MFEQYQRNKRGNSLAYRQHFSPLEASRTDHWLIDWMRLIPLVLLLLAFAPPGECHPPLQLYLKLTPPGGVLKLEPGTYSGPAIIDSPITIDGGGKVTIDGGGDGTVVSVKADNVTLRGLHITNSGDSHDQTDAGILLEANDVRIEDNVIDDVLFGIQLRKAHDNTIRGNRIFSRPTSLTLRGEGLRLWYSSENLIEDNQFEQVRDLYITNSPDNRFIGNTIHDSRVAMEFVFSPGNLVERNDISENGRGIVIVYSNEIVLRDNQLHHMRAFAGAALSLKESSQVLIEGNEILHCTVGVTANSPIHPENIFRMQGNRFAYNDIALYFYGEKGGHIIHDNSFEQNIRQIAVSSPTSALAHDWAGNQWDDYRGFDLDGNGFGDQPYDVYLYSDRIWMDRPMTRFFRGSPIMEALDFVERLTAYSTPKLILRDPTPRMAWPPQTTRPD